jgi:hypothetical protein
VAKDISRFHFGASGTASPLFPALALEYLNHPGGRMDKILVSARPSSGSMLFLPRRV